MAYRLANPPADAQRWIVDEFRKLEQAWATGMDKIRLDPQYAAPEKPRDGMILVADGTTWNPGSGAGAYCYYGAAWHFLG